MTHSDLLDNKIQSNETPFVALIDLEQFGIDRAQIIEAFSTIFAELPWDTYDVRKKQFDLLKKAFPDQLDRLDALFPRFFSGKEAVNEIQEYISRLDKDARAAWSSIKPWRRRAIYNFSLEWRENKWEIQSFYSDEFRQNAVSDYRQLTRIFEKMSPAVYTHPLFTKLLTGLASTVREISHVEKMNIICHQTRVIARDGMAGSNSPEGIHQDGFPFIVSALVVQRHNITGAESRVYCEERKEYILKHTLESGQGILQADKGSSLWHYVTDFYNEDVSRDGFRDSFGFDIDI